jgi:DNA-directed RNA polymerase alpha subunit
MTSGKEYVPFLEKKAQQETNMKNPSKITLATLIPSLALSARPYNALMNDRLYTIRDVVECSSKELLRVPNFGPKCLEEVEALLASAGLALAWRKIWRLYSSYLYKNR